MCGFRMRLAPLLLLGVGCTNHPLAALGQRLGFGGGETASSSGGGNGASSSSGGATWNGLLPGPQVEDVYRPSAVRPCPASDQSVRRPAADFLFVVDNSGSMLEEQTNLGLSASSLCRPDRPCTNACGDLERVEALRAFMAGPACDVPVEEWSTRLAQDGAYYAGILRDCSFFERLYVFDVDWRVGVITTEMRTEDGVRFQDGTWRCLTSNVEDGGARPNRRCLQPDPLTGARVLESGVGTHQEQVDAFRRAVLNVGTCGGGLEAGLWQVENFLSAQPMDGGTAECHGDPALALRTTACVHRAADGACLQEAEPVLVVTVLSDEEDCSHKHGLESGPDFSQLGTARLCYDQPESLRPVAEFVDALRAARQDPAKVRMGALVAGYNTPEDAFVSASCRCNPQHLGALPVTSCRPMMGNSILTSRCGVPVDVALCLDNPDPRTIPPDAGISEEDRLVPCCIADAAGRYVDTARAMDRWVLGSICAQNYHQAMSALADLAR